MSKSAKSVLSQHRSRAFLTVSHGTLSVMHGQKHFVNAMRARILFPFLVATGTIKLPEPPQP